MPLSWSVAMVCSLRPSLPKASQQTRRQIDAAPLRDQRHQALGQHVVEVADQLGELARAHALAEQVAREAADVGGHSLQRARIRRRADRRADLLQRQALQREQVALGDDADDAALLVGHRHMADAVAATSAAPRPARCAAGRACAPAGSSRCSIGAVSGNARQRDAAEDVVARQDAERRRRCPHRPPASSRCAGRASRASASAAASSGGTLTAARRSRSPSGVSSDCSASDCEAYATCSARRDSSRNCCTRRFRKSANGALSRASACSACAGSARQKVSVCAV